MGFVYRVLWILTALWTILSETINILRNLPPLQIILGAKNVCHRCVYIAHSNDCSLLTLSLPFKVIHMKFEVVFWCPERECCTFQKTDNSFKYTNYIMALFTILNSKFLPQCHLHFYPYSILIPTLMPSLSLCYPTHNSIVYFHHSSILS